MWERKGRCTESQRLGGKGSDVAWLGLAWLDGASFSLGVFLCVAGDDVRELLVELGVLTDDLLEVVERVLEAAVAVRDVRLVQYILEAHVRGSRRQPELDSCLCLQAAESEGVRVQRFDACGCQMVAARE